MAVNNKGFTLLEALVAVLVIALGLLGLSGLQMISLRTTNEGFLRTQATALAQDLAERVRANPLAVQANAFAALTAAAPYSVCASAPSACSAAACSPVALAAYDFYTVACGAAPGDQISGARNLLPEGGLTLTCSDFATDPDVTCAITVRWRELADHHSAISAATVTQVDMRFQP